MKTLRLTLAAAALSLAATLAPAATVGGYTGFVAFGDSLTDPGNLYAATGNTFPPSPPYFDGRFSNGPTWAETFADAFTAASRNSANFAYGGANAVPNGDAVPDLPLQLGIFASLLPPGFLGARPLASLWFGANDIFNYLDQTTTTLAGAVAVAEDAADAVADGAFALAFGGITDVLLFNLPDLGSIPRFALFDQPDAGNATAATDAFNARLDANADLLRLAGVNVIEIDIHSLFDALIANPLDFGLTNATQPCIEPDFSSICTLPESLDWAFFDQSHPNLVVHDVIASKVTAAVVPLPASAVMLLAGLGGLAALRRRAA
jgi:outer membrane lipase/esterase